MRWGRVVGAALGLLLLAAPAGIGTVRAQTADDFTAPAECSDPPPASQQDGISVAVGSPTGVEPRPTPSVPVEATFTNQSQDFLNRPNGEITQMRASVLSCAAGQVVPTSPEPTEPEGEPRTASFTWDAQFTTNGRYAIVLEADGASSPPARTQSARVVVPVVLAVPPKKPTNVEVSDPSNGIVTVSWDYVDPEPDLFGFEVRRARQGSGEYTTIKNGALGPKARSAPDAPPVGAWRYQVVAYRQGAPDGAVSRDDTVEVADAAPSADTTDTAGTSTDGGANAGDGTSSTLASSAPGSPSTPRASVDLSQFAAALNARRTTPTLRVEPPDPGFDETLPFAPREAELEAEDPEELGADEPNVGLGQRVVADPGERQRSLGFVAFGLLLFVLSMTGLFLKSEVKRADLLDLDPSDAEPDGADRPAVEPAEDRPLVAATAAAAALPRRRRRTPITEAPAEAPPLEPPVNAVSAARTRRSRPDSEQLPVPPVVGHRVLTIAAPEEASSRRPRPRRSAAPSTDPAPVAANRGSAIEIPETRRRWSGRPAAAATNGHAPVATTAAHDFDDLADEPSTTIKTNANGAAATRTSRRRPAAPLDAPSLDIPDPVAATRTRPRKPTAKASMPARRAVKTTTKKHTSTQR